MLIAYMVTFTKISKEVLWLSKLVSNTRYLNPATCTEVWSFFLFEAEYNDSNVCLYPKVAYLKTKTIALCLIPLKLYINCQYDYSWSSPFYLEVILLK